jgi:hypothetical protein
MEILSEYGNLVIINGWFETSASIPDFVEGFMVERADGCNISNIAVNEECHGHR